MTLKKKGVILHAEMVEGLKWILRDKSGWFYAHCWFVIWLGTIFIVVVAIGFQIILYGNLKDYMRMNLLKAYVVLLKQYDRMD